MSVRWALGMLALVAAGCSTSAPPRVPAVFFPPPPDLPRVQFLTSFSGLKDIEKQSAFSRFVVGEKQDVRVDKPYGVAAHEGRIYVCDTNASVGVFDLRAKTFSLLKGAVGRGQLSQPLNIRIDTDGTKYVADPVRGQVVVFDRDDEYLTAYGAPDAWRPVDALPSGDRLYVADATANLVVVLDKQSGTRLKTIGDTGDPAERLDRPTNLAVDAAGDLYVTDVGRFQVIKFDRDGHFKRTFGQPGDTAGHFARPKGIALDRAGRLYVVDASFNNVQVFTPEGYVLGFFGEGGERPGDLLLPAQIAIDYDNLKYFEPFVDPSFRPEYLVVVTSQFGPRRVNVLAYGREEGKTYPTDAELLRQIDQRRRQGSKK